MCDSRHLGLILDVQFTCHRASSLDDSPEVPMTSTFRVAWTQSYLLVLPDFLSDAYIARYNLHQSHLHLKQTLTPHFIYHLFQNLQC